MSKPNNYSHIIKYTGLFGGIQGLSILVGLVRNKLVAIILGPQGMGLSSLLSSMAKLVSDSTNFGLAMSAIREISDAYNKGDEQALVRLICVVRSWCVLTAILGMMVCVLASPFFNSWSFSWGNHLLHYICLAPLIGMMAITGGETAILKATRRLGQLARISVYNVFAALVVSVPIYYFFRDSGIVPSLVLVGLVQMLTTIAFSYRYYPLHLSFNRVALRQGSGIVKLGLAFVLAGIIGSGTEFIIRAYLNTAGDMEVVGLYNAGYMLSVTYAGMVFTAMETDYFPRLSAAFETKSRAITMVNNQSEVSLLIISPLVVMFIIGLPIILPTLYSGKFMPVIGMIQVSAIAMFMKSLYLPIEYMPLAKGDSKSYLFVEGVADSITALFVITGYRIWGLTGTGIGLLAAYTLEYIFSYVYTSFKYGYCISASLVKYIALQLPIIVAAYTLTFVHSPLAYWGGGTITAVVSMLISAWAIRQNSDLWERVLRRIKK